MRKKSKESNFLKKINPTGKKEIVTKEFYVSKKICGVFPWGYIRRCKKIKIKEKKNYLCISFLPVGLFL